MADQALEVKSFAGMTDNYIGSNPSKSQLLKNWTITRGDVPKLETRKGSEVYNSLYAQLPFVSSTTRVDSLQRFNTDNIYQTKNNLYFEDTGGFTELTGPTSHSAFPSTVVENNKCSYADWNNHLIVANDKRVRPVFIIKDSGTFYLRTLGLPNVNTAGITFSVAAAAARIYAFVYAETYTIDGVSFTNRGPVQELPYTGAIPNSITNLPVLVNGADDNYATSSIKLEIYRTGDTEAVFYKVGEVTNGTTSFTDSIVDGDLTDGILLYLENDDLDYDQPPKCKYVVQLNGVTYYLNIEDSLGGVYPNRLVQANADAIYAAPEGNTLDVDHEFTGGAVAGQNIVVFTSDKVYRLDGTYDSTGSGGINKVEISRTAGCVSHKSIVQTKEGCFFAAKDGFYFTDGYQVLRISEDIPETYKSSADSTVASKIYGTFDTVQKRIYWAASSSSDVDENDIIYVAHLAFGIQPETPFTVWDGGYWPDNFQPTALLFYDGILLRGDTRGYLLSHNDAQKNDVKINEDISPSTWTVLPIIYDLYSSAFDFGDVTRRKWVTKAIVYADALARVSMTIFSNNDNTGLFTELAEIRTRLPVLWGDKGIVWGDTSIKWNYIPIVNGIRRFPRSSIRCSYKQIRITNSYTKIDTSDYSGNASVNATAKTVTILDTSFPWESYALDYYISFPDDDYVTQYKITARTDTVLTVEDASNLLTTNASTAWKIYGYRKNEALRLLSFSLIYQSLTTSQTPFRADA